MECLNDLKWSANGEIIINSANMYLVNLLSKRFRLHQRYTINKKLIGWAVVFGFNGPLRLYFSLYRAFSQREGERREKRQRRVKMFKQPLPASTASAVGPCPTLNRISRTPRHLKFTQHNRTTRPPRCLDVYFSALG